jgi:hypothetical protein
MMPATPRGGWGYRSAGDETGVHAQDVRRRGLLEKPAKRAAGHTQVITKADLQ